MEVVELEGEYLSNLFCECRVSVQRVIEQVFVWVQSGISKNDSICEITVKKNPTCLSI